MCFHSGDTRHTHDFVWLACKETRFHVALLLNFYLPWNMASRKLCTVQKEESGVFDRQSVDSAKDINFTKIEKL